MKLTENTLALLDQFLNAFEKEIGFRPSDIQLKKYRESETFINNLIGLEKDSYNTTHWAQNTIRHNDITIEATVFYTPDEEEEELKRCEHCKEEFEYTEDIEEKLCTICLEEALARADEEKRYMHDEYRNSVL